jgi:small-conductance mechanosensitive channel
VVGFDALGLPAVSEVLRDLLLWLPNLAVALVVLIIGGLAANTVSRLVRGATAEADFDNPEFLAKLAAAAVWAFAVVVAVNQIGVATALVNTLFMAVVGAFALALGLAFGLGGRDTAADIVRSWDRKARNNRTKLSTAAQAAGESSKQSGTQGSKQEPQKKGT